MTSESGLVCIRPCGAQEPIFPEKQAAIFLSFPASSSVTPSSLLLRQVDFNDIILDALTSSIPDMVGTR